MPWKQSPKKKKKERTAQKQDGNNLRNEKSKNHNGDLMYFVHSYYVVPAEQDVVLASSEYGGKRFCSALQKENICATQFHPEKSGDVGLKIYEQLRKKLSPQV